MKAVGNAVLFGVVFGLLGAVGGFVVGLGISTFDDVVLGKGNAQGPMLFLLTGPIGVFVGMFYGWIRGYRSPAQGGGQTEFVQK